MPGEVFVLPVPEGWLLSSPLAGSSALVNSGAVRDVAAGRVSGLASALTAEDGPPEPYTGPARPEFLGLIPTRGCNLACRYCGFGAAPSAEIMDPVLAVAAIDWMAEHVRNSGGDTVNVHFFGGEPLYAPELVEIAVHRARTVAVRDGLKARFEVATNGVCSEARARFLGDYFDVVALSFDGAPEVQNRHRPFADGRGSFERVLRTARVLAGSPTDLCLRLCATRDTVDELPDTVEHFVTEFRPSRIDVEMLQPNAESARAGLSPPDPFVFAARFWRARQRAAAFGVETMFAAAMPVNPRLTFCPVGNDTAIVHPDGRITACYLLETDWRTRGLDLRLGHADSSGLQFDDAAVARVRALIAEKPRCTACFCRWSCAGGCHVNNTYPGCSTSYNDFCIAARIISACMILEGLGRLGSAEQIVGDYACMERLVRRHSDRLEDWDAAGT